MGTNGGGFGHRRPDDSNGGSKAHRKKQEESQEHYILVRGVWPLEHILDRSTGERGGLPAA